MVDNTPQSRFFALDGLRGLLALCIAVLHFNSPFMRGAWLSVDIFFVLSGFVLSRSLEARAQTLSDFAKRRFERLYPLHLYSLLVFGLAIWIGTLLGASAPVYQQGYVYSFLTNVFLLQDSPFIVEGTWNSPSWFLASLFWASLIYYGFWNQMKAQKINPWAAFILPAALYNYVICLHGTLNIHHTNDFVIINVALLRGLAGLILGGAAHSLYHYLQERARLQQKLTLALQVLLYAYPLLVITFFSYDPHNPAFEMCICLLTPVWLVALLTMPSKLGALLGAPALVWLGGISYAIYLNQYLIKGIARLLHSENMLSLFVYLIVVVVYSNFSQKFVNAVLDRIQKLISAKQAK